MIAKTALVRGTFVIVASAALATAYYYALPREAERVRSGGRGDRAPPVERSAQDAADRVRAPASQSGPIS